MTKTGPKNLNRDKIMAIFTAPGPYKNIAADLGVSLSLVRMVKCGARHRDVTAPWREAAALNAALVSAACGVAG
jgi:hypothetical protein